MISFSQQKLIGHDWHLFIKHSTLNMNKWLCLTASTILFKRPGPSLSPWSLAYWPTCALIAASPYFNLLFGRMQRIRPSEDDLDELPLPIPASRMRNMMKSSPDVDCVSTESVVCLIKATVGWKYWFDCLFRSSSLKTFWNSHRRTIPGK